ncbi:tol-pal system protein YbgF [Rhodobacterales bacterium]|nr:tol-pal system protein YbgF [Rhodobacterales bacterium]
MQQIKGLTGLLVALVFIVAATPSQAQLFGRKNDDSAVRITQLEERIRTLTGQIEQLSYQMRELQDQMRRMQEDNEYRFQQLEGGGGTPGKRSEATPGSTAPGASAPGLAADGTPLSEPLVTPGGGFATLPSDGSGDADWSDTGGYQGGDGPVDLSNLANGLENLPGAGESQVPDQTLSTEEDSIAGIIASGDPRTDYDEAYSHAVNGDYAAAEQGFRTFLENYPDDELAANAQYWLGESLLSQQNYREAADAFLKTYTDHPGSKKSPDSLLKLGVSLRGLGEGQAACATFSELLNKYPNAAPAVLTQARDERRRAQCT